MSSTSRRTFLVGAGALTTAVVVPGGEAAALSSSSARPGTEQVVAHVSDPASGTLVLYVGTEARVVRDRALVQRLVRAAGRR